MFLRYIETRYFLFIVCETSSGWETISKKTWRNKYFHLNDDDDLKDDSEMQLKHCKCGPVLSSGRCEFKSRSNKQFFSWRQQCKIILKLWIVLGCIDYTFHWNNFQCTKTKICIKCWKTCKSEFQILELINERNDLLQVNMAWWQLYLCRLALKKVKKNRVMFSKAVWLSGC